MPSKVQYDNKFYIDLFHFLDCSSPMIGDGYCDDRFNLPLEGCGFDGGDCCDQPGQPVNTLFCEHCLCLDENIVSEDECRHDKVCKIRF